MEVITLLRTAEILVLRRPRVTTTAMVMTPSTTAYSAIVWPDSSLRSANRRLRYSIKEFTSPHPVSRSRRGRRILFTLFRQMPWSLEGLVAISPVWGNCRQRRISLIGADRFCGYHPLGCFVSRVDSTMVRRHGDGDRRQTDSGGGTRAGRPRGGRVRRRDGPYARPCHDPGGRGPSLTGVCPQQGRALPGAGHGLVPRAARADIEPGRGGERRRPMERRRAGRRDPRAAAAAR